MRMVKYHETRAGSLWMDVDRLTEASVAPEMGGDEYRKIAAEHGVKLDEHRPES